MHIHYSKLTTISFAIGIALSLSVFATVEKVHAAELEKPINKLVDDAFHDLLKESKTRVLDQFGSSLDWLSDSTQKISPAHNAVIDEIVKNSTKSVGVDRIKERQLFNTIIFVSYSMPNNELAEIMNQVAGDDEAIIVMRGIPKGYNITEGIRNMQLLAASFEKTPNIALDPTAFKKFDITAVPSIVMLEQSDSLDSNTLKSLPDSQQEAFEMLANASKEGQRKDQLQKSPTYIAKVAGISNTQWLKGQVRNGKTGDLGVQGPILEIAEPDLIEVMKKKVTEIDWNEKRENAIKNYWPSRDFLVLPEATKSRTRKVDASVVVTDDIRTPSGKFVAKKGDRVNPLNTRPFTQAIVIFDARSKDQLNTVLRERERIKNKAGVKKIVYIASAMDKDKGWDGFKNLTEQLDDNLFVLTNDVRERFAIERVPSVITADDTHFIVQEIPIKHDAEEKISEGQ